ncbi:MAG: SpoIID/LytB domain-containing protein, partial [Candidatus Omnitrophica bacterium]|nr:SpoIID/LytB domain-containing protein [Candidatus Omnitrophota bacterium]
EDIENGRVLARDVDLASAVEITGRAEGIRFKDCVLTSAGVRIIPKGKFDIALNDIFYRGVIDVIRVGGTLDAINRVGLEDYLKGVIPREVNYLWPAEALKAQAIASRSFAVSQVERRGKSDYDLRASTFSQAYGGRSAERLRTSKAVGATRGKVLAYAGKVLPAYFHSCCGGRTQSASNLWGELLPPLEGVECRRCGWSPYFRWQARVSTKVIKKRLNDAGYDIPRIDDIKTGVRDKSGRLDYISVRPGGKWFDIKCDDFIRAIGPRVLRSTNLRVKKYPFFYRFSGYGWGHGVGMCQWGAFGLAIRWRKADSILNHYYPGAEIVDLKENNERRGFL